MAAHHALGAILHTPSNNRLPFTLQHPSYCLTIPFSPMYTAGQDRRKSSSRPASTTASSCGRLSRASSCLKSASISLSCMLACDLGTRPTACMHVVRLPTLAVTSFDECLLLLDPHYGCMACSHSLEFVACPLVSAPVRVTLPASYNSADKVVRAL